MSKLTFNFYTYMYAYFNNYYTIKDNIFLYFFLYNINSIQDILIIPRIQLSN